VTRPAVGPRVGAAHAHEALLAGHSYDVDAYLTSWVLYRFLWNNRGKQLSEYQQRLMDGVRTGCVASHVSRVGLAAQGHLLDWEVGRHQLNGRGLRWEIKIGAVDRVFRSLPASPGDMHLALLRFRLLQTNSLIHSRIRRQALERRSERSPDTGR